MRLATVISSLIGVASAGLVNIGMDPRQAATLNAAMVRAGREYIGTSLTIRGDGTETSIIQSEFGSITPENAMKWDATEPNRGQFSFGGADQHANWARQNKKLLRCHTLVWHSQLPAWVANGRWSNSTLIQVMRTHIQNVAGRYKGQCSHWDVVNEALNEDGTYRDSVFLRVIGEAYIPLAFQIASEVDPNAKLYYNDYNLEYGGAKTQGAARIVKLVQKYGARIDGVGLQAHMVVEPTPTQSTPTPDQATLAKSLRVFTDLGVDVAYTEIDIRMNQPFTAAKLQAQSNAYARMAGACMEVKRCVGMTIWGVSDKYSWVPSTFNGEGAALLWDNGYSKKPAYTGFLNAIIKGGKAT